MKPGAKLKSVAFYYPEYYNISFFKYFDFSKSTNCIDIYNMTQLIKAQTLLAKNYGIYHFDILFNLYQSDNFNKISIDYFLDNIRFPFFLYGEMMNLRILI